jgi:V8-like Glu-specific endopeptidase
LKKLRKGIRGTRKIYGMFVLSVALYSSQSLTLASPKVIYGEDNRQELDQYTDRAVVELGRSTAAMISPSQLSPIRGKPWSEVKGKSLQSQGVCADERFAQETAGARCSGFLVAPDVLVTAGHCVTSEDDCADYVWVFDFKVPARGTEDFSRTVLKVPNTSIYKCKEIISQSLDSITLLDYAVIRLEKAVTDRSPLRIRQTGKVADGAPVVVIGHPSGLPTKVADHAAVRSNDNNIYFVTNLDTYGGNSGSAVFNRETLEVEGILVRGENDYVYDPAKNCRVSNVCEENACRGEDVTRITLIGEYIKQ